MLNLKILFNCWLIVLEYSLDFIRPMSLFLSHLRNINVNASGTIVGTVNMSLHKLQ